MTRSSLATARRQIRRNANSRKTLFETLEDRQLLTSTPGLPWLETAELTASNDFDTGDHAGQEVSISGDTIVVSSDKDDDAGFDAGAAYVYVRDDAGTPGNREDDAWLKQAKLIGSDATTEDEFGRDVDIQGDTIVAGAWQRDNAGAGAAYVFRRTGSTWTEVAKLTASDGAASDLFGRHVAIDGDTIVVTAFFDDDSGDASGSAYVFVEPAGGWSGNLTETMKLTASDGLAGGRFGRSVDLAAGTILVGASQAGVGSGSAYIFDRTNGPDPLDPSDDVWEERAILTGNDSTFGDALGANVAINGTRAVVTAIGDDHSGVVGAGSAYVFERQDNGTPNDMSDDSWIQVSKLTASDPGTSDQFGRGVDVEGETIVVGAWSGEIEVADSGSVYFFQRQSNGTWQELGEVTASDPQSDNNFGSTKIDLEGDTLVVGDPQHGHNGAQSGGAFVFTKSDSSIVASDLFESGSFSGGLGQWSSGGWTTSGDASIRSDSDPHSGTHHARLRRSSGDLRRTIDVSDLTNVKLRFWSKLSSFESSDQAHVQVSDNGSSWTTLTTFVNGQDDNQYHFYELDLPDLGDTLHIRFDAAMSNSKDYWYIDNVEVTGVPAGPPSQPPAITTSPVTSATEDVPYSYDVDAIDPDAGDTLTFSLDAAPGGMTINANSGLIQWTPRNADVGSNSVIVRVQDQTGASTTQSYSVDVVNTNDAPEIISATVTSGTDGTAYAYDVNAVDPDANDTATYSLDQSPSGMTINASTGVISWTPQSADVGSANDVTVRVTDSAGASDTQSFSINVSAPSENAIFVSDISFESKRRDRDWRAVFEVRDQDNNPISGVQLEVTFAGNIYTGTTDSNGVFRTSWIRNLSSGNHYAEAADLAFANHDWDRDLGWSEDYDGDGLPDALLEN